MSDAKRHQAWVIAHRGFSAKAPENTLAALRLAAAVGADYAECDVRLSSDAVPVLSHDWDLARLAGLDTKISDVSAEALSGIDVGAWFSPDFKGEGVPSLALALDTLVSTMGLVIELKAHGMAREVCHVIRQSSVPLSRTILKSFHWNELQVIRDDCPQVRTMWLVSEALGKAMGHERLLSQAHQAGLWGMSVESGVLDSQWPEMARSLGLHLFAWTVNTPEEWRRLDALQVSGIITDHPDRLMSFYSSE